MNPVLPLILALATLPAFAARGLDDESLQAYFEGEVARIESNGLDQFETLDEWKKARPRLREQLFEMLSLSPLPERTPLQPEVTGRIEHEEFVVEKLHFQSMPGLYVTANLYLPKEIEEPVPAILYVCGHGEVKLDGVSYGNKVTYQHHGAWFARNGYACLTLDTIQLGEIEGIHHGTYREGMWWWNSRGYTPAGVEAWNCIRALDYLETRPEIDSARFGVTGRSGGGAYSWWITALDERIKVSAPVAGITDLRDHVVGGVVEGHCDCMFMVNTYRWDYPMVAALAAPRPLLICNSDKDTIFPLDGVIRTHAQVARIYDLYDAEDNLGLLITEGPHKDTQDLRVPVFRWFNRFLKEDDAAISMPAKKFFSPSQLKVFEELPEDERTSNIHETFVPVAKLDGANPTRLADALKQKVFRGWPEATVAFNPERRESSGGEWIEVWFDSQEEVRLPLFIHPARNGNAARVRLEVIGGGGWDQAAAAKRAEAAPDATFVFFAPRGVGPNAWKGDARKQIQIRRRFMLVGQTADSMRVWDIKRALEILQTLPETTGLPREAAAEGEMGVNLAYAALLSPRLVGELRLENLPASHSEGPDYLNVLRVTDIPEVLEVLRGRGLLADEGYSAKSSR